MELSTSTIEALPENYAEQVISFSVLNYLFCIGINVIIFLQIVITMSRSTLKTPAKGS